jgi:hypothetical protein
VNLAFPDGVTFTVRPISSYSEVVQCAGLAFAANGIDVRFTFPIAEPARGVYSVTTLLTAVSVDPTLCPLITSSVRPNPSNTVFVHQKLSESPVVT